jgi:DNA-binding FadR family transcriptional regulator
MMDSERAPVHAGLDAAHAAADSAVAGPDAAPATLAPAGPAAAGRAAAHPAPVIPGGFAPSRAVMAADLIGALAQSAQPGARLGTKEDLRRRCGVSVGTFNEAVRLLQSRGLVAVRPGPGGGLFAAEQNALVRLGNSVLALDAEQASVADAVRIRDALDELLVQDALWYASPADIAAMSAQLARMAEAAAAADPTAFVRANWRLHACMAAVSPNAMLRSIYLSLLELIESHTLSVLPVPEQPMPDYLQERYRLHCDLVDAIARQDRAAALRLSAAHTTSAARTGPAAARHAPAARTRPA